MKVKQTTLSSLSNSVKNVSLEHLSDPKKCVENLTQQYQKRSSQAVMFLFELHRWLSLSLPSFEGRKQKVSPPTPSTTVTSLLSHSASSLQGNGFQTSLLSLSLSLLSLWRGDVIGYLYPISPKSIEMRCSMDCSSGSRWKYLQHKRPLLTMTGKYKCLSRS